MKVSVALCTYNGESFLGQQLVSILEQSIEVNEIVICDDKSTDKTHEIIKKFTHLNTKIRYYQNEQQLGVVKNFEKAMKLCSGDVIFFSDQDDRWKADKVKRTFDYFNADPFKLGVFSNADLIDDQDKLSGETLWSSIFFSPAAEASNNIFKFLCTYKNVVSGACLAIRKEAVNHITPFTSDSNLLHDEWIGLKLAQDGKFGFINEALVEYRIHQHQQTRNMWHKTEEDNARFLSLLNNEVEKDPLYHYRHWKKRSKHLIKLKALGITVSSEIEQELKCKRKMALMELVKQKKMLPRKWQLFKYLVKQQENISVVDLIKL